LGIGRYFSFLIPNTVDRAPCTGYQPVARPLPTHRIHAHIMPSVGFEPTIPAFERAKTGHALDLAATVISNMKKMGDWKYTFIQS
jgi:hypothetical protein